MGAKVHVLKENNPEQQQMCIRDRVFHRVHDIYPVEVLSVLIRLFRVPNRSIGRCVDNRADYTATVGTLKSRINTIRTCLLYTSRCV